MYRLFGRLTRVVLNVYSAIRRAEKLPITESVIYVGFMPSQTPTGITRNNIFTLLATWARYGFITIHIRD
jgi:hypothetical protein